MSTSSKQILIIDDDQKLCALLQEYLGRFDYQVDARYLPSTGLQHLEQQRPDLVILDVMLPEMDGFEVLKQIRRSSQVPVIMLTARGEVTDKVVGLELGADDYLPKPFEPRELVARIQTVLRRLNGGNGNTNDESATCLTSDDLELDLLRRNLKVNGEAVELTTMEYELLAILMQQPGQLLSRNDLMEQIRGIDWDALNRSIDMSISRLRQKLGDDPKSARYIKTVRAKGYQFIAPVQVHHA